MPGLRGSAAEGENCTLNNTKGYFLADGVRIYTNGNHEYRIRKGIWNFNEAAINVANQSPELQSDVAYLVQELSEGRAVDVDGSGVAGVFGDTTGKNIVELLETLHERKFLRRSDELARARVLEQLMGGGVLNHNGPDFKKNGEILWFADTQSGRTKGEAIAADAELPFRIVNKTLVDGLIEDNLCDETDAVSYRQRMEHYRSLFAEGACIAGCFEYPSLVFLRNLNRLAITFSKPMVIGFIDGPFISVLAIKPTETACFECFEQRQLARIQDSNAYNNFAKATMRYPRNEHGTAINPLIHLLSSAVLFECALISSAGTSRIGARVVSVYLPILEIQVQDLLRIPYCPACGFSARAYTEELYTSSKAIVDEILGTINSGSA